MVYLPYMAVVLVMVYLVLRALDQPVEVEKDPTKPTWFYWVNRLDAATPSVSDWIIMALTVLFLALLNYR